MKNPKSDLKLGDRVEFTVAVDRYPHFFVPKGATGTVATVIQSELIGVKLDAPMPGAEEWGNEVHFYLRDEFTWHHEELTTCLKKLN